MTWERKWKGARSNSLKRDTSEKFESMTLLNFKDIIIICAPKKLFTQYHFNGSQKCCLACYLWLKKHNIYAFPYMFFFLHHLDKMLCNAFVNHWYILWSLCYTNLPFHIYAMSKWNVDCIDWNSHRLPKLNSEVVWVWCVCVCVCVHAIYACNIQSKRKEEKKFPIYTDPHYLCAWVCVCVCVFILCLPHIHSYSSAG